MSHAFCRDGRQVLGSSALFIFYFLLSIQWRNSLNNIIAIVSHHRVPPNRLVSDPLLSELGRLGVRIRWSSIQNFQFWRFFFSRNALRGRNKWIMSEGHYQGNGVGGEPCPAQPLRFLTGLSSYMEPSVVVKQVDRSTSRPFFFK